MTRLEKFILIFFALLIFMMLVKSMANILTVAGEVKSKPVKINIGVCPAKKEGFFSQFKDGGYLFALYRYKSMGVKCKK